MHKPWLQPLTHFPDLVLATGGKVVFQKCQEPRTSKHNDGIGICPFVALWVVVYARPTGFYSPWPGGQDSCRLVPLEYNDRNGLKLHLDIEPPSWSIALDVPQHLSKSCQASHRQIFNFVSPYREHPVHTAMQTPGSVGIVATISVALVPDHRHLHMPPTLVTVLACGVHHV
ncbi:hypothetical protein Tco_0516318 [Tanacetum coccineum]